MEEVVLEWAGRRERHKMPWQDEVGQLVQQQQQEQHQLGEQQGPP